MGLYLVSGQLDAIIGVAADCGHLLDLVAGARLLQNYNRCLDIIDIVDFIDILDNIIICIGRV